MRRFKLKYFTAAVVFGLLALLLEARVVAQPAQIILIRHAEKPDDPTALHLSPRGQERAQALVKFVTTNRKAARYGPPVALYATRPTRRGHGQRPRETLEPLAAELRLPIHTPYESEDYGRLARDVLQNKSYAGKTVIICWVHEFLPDLAGDLGVNPQPAKWKNSVFDLCYIITPSPEKTSLDLVYQKLLPGDNKYKE